LVGGRKFRTSMFETLLEGQKREVFLVEDFNNKGRIKEERGQHLIIWHREHKVAVRRRRELRVWEDGVSAKGMRETRRKKRGGHQYFGHQMRYRRKTRGVRSFGVNPSDRQARGGTR